MEVSVVRGRKQRCCSGHALLTKPHQGSHEGHDPVEAHEHGDGLMSSTPMPCWK